MKYVRPTSFILLLIIGITIAITFPATRSLSQSQMVEVNNLPDVFIKAGKTNTIAIPFQIKYGYHIQADTVNDPNLIAAELTFENIEGIDPGKLDYPDYHEFQLNGTDEKLLVFDGSILIKVDISASATMAKGHYLLPGSLYYQACDSSRCLFPRKINFQLPIEVSH